MSKIVEFIKWLWNGLVSFFTWFVGLPSLIVSSVVGLYSSLSQIFGALVTGNDFVSSWFNTFDGAAEGLNQTVSSAPDIVKLAMYALSMDTLFTYILSVMAVFLVLVVSILTFFCVSVPVFFLNMYAVKMAAWFICALFPRGYSITGVSALANLNISRPVREALRDGKYNPWLGG